MGENNSTVERKSAGCGLINAVFGKNWSRRSSSASAGSSTVAANNTATTTASDSKRRRSGSNDVVLADAATSNNTATINYSSSRSVTNVAPPSSNSNLQKPFTTNQNPQRKQQQQQQQPSQTQRGTAARVSPTVGQGRKVPQESIGISGELESMINDHQKNRGSSNLVRASSSNVMLFGNLGNLRQGTGQDNSYQSVMDYNGGHKNNGANRSNEAKPIKEQQHQPLQQQRNPGSLCRALSTRGDPEQLKIMGNEDYKNGRFAEALSLYDAAIAMDPNKASYRSNRSAALTALGRILEAVFECREAIQIEPHYQRAHHRLGNLHVRLGETDKAHYHYKQAGHEADPDEVAKVKVLQVHLNKCTEARRQGDWNKLISETRNAISAGADSAPQIFALQAEALLKLRRHQDADNVMSKCPHFDVDQCTKFFGPIGNANLLVTRAQIHMAAGRFEDALEAAQKAARLDSNNRDASKVLRKVQGVTAARARGNELFKASKFSEACIAYGEGLEHDSYNSLLLCNRAACRSKLGQFEKAVEDCNAALNLRPSYSKARLRRADCNAKLQRWQASIEDYEILLKETPKDEEVNAALSEAREQLKKQQG